MLALVAWIVDCIAFGLVVDIIAGSVDLIIAVLGTLRFVEGIAIIIEVEFSIGIVVIFSFGIIVEGTVGIVDGMVVGLKMELILHNLLSIQLTSYLYIYMNLFQIVHPFF